MKQWKRIFFLNGEESEYLISNYGEVKSLITNKILKPEIRAGYYSVNLYHNGKRFKKHIHRLVALAFVERTDLNKSYVNHIDGNKLNNHWTNLEWVTASENSKHAFKMKLRKNKSGEESHLNKYKKEKIIKVCQLLQEGFPPSQISEITGVSEKMIYLIRSKKIWKEVVENFNFPKLKYKHSKVYPLKLRLEIENLVRKNYSNKEIYKALNLKPKKSIQDLIYRIRKSVGEGSTTIESPIVINIEL